jgi:hypothetical protein
VVAVEEHGTGPLGKYPAIMRAMARDHGINYDNMNVGVAAKVKAASRNVFLATTILNQADPRRHKELQTSVSNHFAMKDDKYPRSITKALDMMDSYKNTSRTDRYHRGGDAASFNTNGEEESGTVNANANGRATFTCRMCKQPGHYARDCLQKETGGTANGNEPRAGNDGGSTEGKGCSSTAFTIATTQGYSFNGGGGPIPSTWVLLDNQSTLDVFSNPSLLENIRSELGSMTIHCNAGTTKTNLVGDLPGYGQVWYNPNGISNILSLLRVTRSGYQVTFDSAKGNGFILLKPDGSCVEFEQSDQGLYYIDMAAIGSLFINTVVDNKSSYTNRECTQADLARRIQRIIGHPSTKDFVNIVNKNLLPNCPITKADIMAAELIYGPEVGSLKGKTVRRDVGLVDAQLTDVPCSILTRHREITLCADVMKVNEIPFLVTISRHIKFGTTAMVQSTSTANIVKSLGNVQRIYSKCGFQVTTLLIDGEFESIRSKVADLGMTLNVVSCDEHVLEVERRISVIKERVRAVWNTLPFQMLLARMIIELVYYANFWLNCFPSANCVSDTISPRGIVDGVKINFKHHCRLQFGEYVQTHEQHDNSMAPRTIGAIALRPTGNDQGGHYFYSLSTGKRITPNRWTALPMPEDVVDRVHCLARVTEWSKVNCYLCHRIQQSKMSTMTTVNTTHLSDPMNQTMMPISLMMILTTNRRRNAKTTG